MLGHGCSSPSPPQPSPGSDSDRQRRSRRAPAAPGTTPGPEVHLIVEDLQAAVQEKAGERSNGDAWLLGRCLISHCHYLLTCTLWDQHGRRCSWDSPAVLGGALLIPLLGRKGGKAAKPFRSSLLLQYRPSLIELKIPQNRKHP